MTNFTPEMIEKAKAAKTAEELLVLAKENNVELTEEEAKAYFVQLNPNLGELTDEELDNVAGGGCGDDQYQIKHGDRVQMRQEYSNNCPICKGRTGIYVSEGSYWSVKCDKENCTGYVVRSYPQKSDPHRTVYKI